MWEEVMIGLRVVLAWVMYDEIKGVTMSVTRDFHMLGKITPGKNVAKLHCLRIAEVVDMDVEVASNEFMRGGDCVERNDENLLRKVEKVWEYGDGVSGRLTLNSVS